MRRCPVDDFTLATEDYEGVEIDRCPHCKGVWLDAGELQGIQDNQDSDFRDVVGSKLDTVSAAINMAKAATEERRKCVSCESELVKREYIPSAQIMIDNCPKGHGIWLDAGELSRLQMFYENESDYADFFAQLEEKDQGLGAKLKSFLSQFKV